MNFKLLAAAAAVALAPMSAHALSLFIEDTSGVGGGDITVVDGGAGDLDSTVNGTIIFQGLVGTVDVALTSSISKDANGESFLQLNVGNLTAGTGDLIINTSDVDYAQGAAMPSAVSFLMNASDLSGGNIDGEGYVDNGNVEFGTATLVGGGTITPATIATSVMGNAQTDLEAPFSMSIFTTVHAGVTTNYDATLTATPVPVPAGILLMGTALAGFGVMRRRKKAA